MTLQQLLKKQKRIKKSKTTSVPALFNCPQRKGTCIKIRIMKPKKPNSAQRKVAKIRLTNKRIINAAIPGQGHNLKEYSEVLVRGGRANDLPGVRYKLIKGCYGFSVDESFKRSKRRSKFGLKKL